MLYSSCCPGARHGGCLAFYVRPPASPSNSLKIFPPHPVTFSPTARPRKPFSCNTYGSPRKCCKQKTYAKAKSFRFRTYKNRGVGGAMVNQPPPAFNARSHNSHSGTRSPQRAPIRSGSSAAANTLLPVFPLASNRHFFTSLHRRFSEPVDFLPLAGHNFPSAPSPRMAPIIEEGE